MLKSLVGSIYQISRCKSRIQRSACELCVSVSLGDEPSKFVSMMTMRIRLSISSRSHDADQESTFDIWGMSFAFCSSRKVAKAVDSKVGS
jgi:hypothetical protein